MSRRLERRGRLPNFFSSIGADLDGLPAHASSSPQSQQGSDIFLRIALGHPTIRPTVG